MPISYATIGTSWITDEWINSAALTGQWELKAVYSRTVEAASKFAEKHAKATTSPIERFTDISELGASPAIQAVYIASPNSHHFEHTKAMLNAGKHVILEKPATSTSAELDELFKIAKEKGVFLIEAFRHIHEVNFAALKQSLTKLGQIYGASLSYASYSSRYDKVLSKEDPPPNIFSPKFSGGSLVDIGVYPISAAIALFGPPQSSTYTPFMLHTGVDGGGSILMRYKEGFGVHINQSKIYTSTAPCEVYGEKGTIVFNAVAAIESIKIVDARTKDAEEVAGLKAKMTLQEEALEFARIIERNDQKATEESAELSRAVIRVTEGLRKDCGVVFDVERR